MAEPNRVQEFVEQMEREEQLREETEMKAFSRMLEAANAGDMVAYRAARAEWSKVLLQ